MLPAGVALHTPAGVLPNTRDVVSLAVFIMVMTICASQVGLAILRRRGVVDRPVPTAVWSAWIAAACSIGAGVLHLAVIQSHLDEYVPFGMAFLALAFVQLVWPPTYLSRPTRRLALAAVAINLGAVAVWLWSRTLGLPIGPEAGLGVAEAIGPADVVATMLEISLVIALIPGLRRSAGGRPEGALASTRATLVVSVAAGLVAFVTLVGLFGLTGSSAVQTLPG